MVNELLFPIERQAILNDVVRSISREEVKDQEELANLITGHVVNTLLTKVWTSLHPDFVFYGQIGGTLYCLYLTVTTISAVLNLVIRGVTLHKLFGFSAKILCACLHALTHYMIIFGEWNSEKEGKIIEVERNINKVNKNEIKPVREDENYSVEYRKNGNNNCSEVVVRKSGFQFD